MKALDEVFDLLRRERRRYALYYLDQQDGPVTIDELTRKISEWELGSSRNEVPDERFEDVILSLEHSHLPRVDDAEHIEYDRENERLRITDASTEFSVILSITKGLERPSTDVDVLDFDDFD